MLTDYFSRGASSRNLTARVKLAMDFLQPRVVNMRVQLRGGDTYVAEHFLDLPQVGAARQEMCRKAVP